MDLGMEEVTSPATLKAALAELIATALFIFMGVGSIAAMIATATEVSGPNIVIIAAAFGFSIAVLAAGVGPISGGHINPAVTFAMIITGQISIAKGLLYIVAQMVGAAIGAGLLRAFLVSDLLAQIPGAGGNAIGGAVPSELAALGIEATITFLLVWTVFATAVSPRGSGNLAPVFIGFAVFVIHLVAIPMTGTGANPARTFGPALMLPDVVEGAPGRWDDVWVYFVGPLLGAALASISYYVLFLMPEDEEATA
jgi:aquaporin PIP